MSDALIDRQAWEAMKSMTDPAFLVELNSPGVTTGDIHGKLGIRAGSTGWLAFQDVRVSVENGCRRRVSEKRLTRVSVRASK